MDQDELGRSAAERDHDSQRPRRKGHGHGRWRAVSPFRCGECGTTVDRKGNRCMRCQVEHDRHDEALLSGMVRDRIGERP